MQGYKRERRGPFIGGGMASREREEKFKFSQYSTKLQFHEGTAFQWRTRRMYTYMCVRVKSRPVGTTTKLFKAVFCSGQV